MKTPIYYLIFLAICLSCNKEQRQRESLVEETLPGAWDITSFEMNGVFKRDSSAQIYSSDTILNDVGSMVFPDLEMDTLALNGGGFGVGIECQITAFGFTERFRIERLFISGDMIRVYFRVNEEGLFVEETELTRLIEFSDLFWQNMILKIENDNLITFTSSNNARIVLTLQRQ